MMRVEMKHQYFGDVVLENITEIHYLYPSVLEKRVAFESDRVAFESDVEGTGNTYDVADIIEFEAKIMSDKPQETKPDFIKMAKVSLEVMTGDTNPSDALISIAASNIAIAEQLTRIANALESMDHDGEFNTNIKIWEGNQ